MTKRFALGLALVVAASGVLQAQDEKTGYELGVYAAQDNWKPRSFQVGPPVTLSPVDVGLRFNDHVAYGVRGNFLSKGHWGGEVSYSYQHNTATFANAGATLALRGSIHNAFYNQIFYLTRYEHTVLPFVTAGLGVAAYRLGDDARAEAANSAALGSVNLKANDSELALNYGAGVKVNAARHFGFRGDFRHILSDMPDFGLPERAASGQFAFPIGGKMQSYEFSGGIYWRFLSNGFN